MPLTDHLLFNNRLKPDVMNGTVFPALRARGNANVWCFYHAGRRLFHFANDTFKTNIKYVAGWSSPMPSDVSEQDLTAGTPITDFERGYEAIKTQSRFFKEPESAAVADLIQKHSFAVSSDPIVVIDVEVQHRSLQTGSDTSRIDLALLNRQTNVLCFVEVKRFVDARLWANDGDEAAIFEQLNRYRTNLTVDGCVDDLLGWYTGVINDMNTLFGTNLNYPTSIAPDVGLLICEFRKSELPDVRMVESNVRARDHKCTSIGNLTSAKSGTLARWWSILAPDQ